MTQEKSSKLGHAASKAMDTVGGLAGQAEAATTSKAPTFVENVAISDMYEIEAGRIALDRSSSPPIREVAQKMIDDHTQSTSKLKKAVTESQMVDGTAMPTRLDTRREKMIKHLRDAPDDGFNKSYVDQQTLAHKEAVTLMHHYRDEGDCPVLRGFAREVAPIIESHLERMKSLQPA